MKTIIFATSNARKLGEARLACDDFGIKVDQLTLDIDEIQHHNPRQIAIRKAEDAFASCKKPVVVGDTSWNIPALNGFPGGYMKDVAEWFAIDDFLYLMENKKDRRISFIETIVFKDSKTTKVFSEEYWGEMTKKPRGIGNGNPIEYIAEFDGHTIAERHDQKRFSHDPKDYVWYKFAQWYGKL